MPQSLSTVPHHAVAQSYVVQPVYVRPSYVYESAHAQPWRVSTSLGSATSSVQPAAAAASVSSHMGRSTAATPIMVHGSWRLSYTGVTADVTSP